MAFFNVWYHSSTTYAVAVKHLNHGTGCDYCTTISLYHRINQATGTGTTPPPPPTPSSSSPSPPALPSQVYHNPPSSSVLLLRPPSPTPSPHSPAIQIPYHQYHTIQHRHHHPVSHNPPPSHPIPPSNTHHPLPTTQASSGLLLRPRQAQQALPFRTPYHDLPPSNTLDPPSTTAPVLR